MRRLIIPAIIVVIAIGAFLFRDRLSSNAGDLKVGDCFEVPAGDTIKDVQHRPCTESHDGEVILVADFPNADTYPTSAQFDSWVSTECVDKSFAAYVGDTFQARQDINLGYFYPQEDAWKNGDRQMICYLSPAATGTKLSVSFKKAPAAS